MNASAHSESIDLISVFNFLSDLFVNAYEQTAFHPLSLVPKALVLSRLGYICNVFIEGVHVMWTPFSVNDSFSKAFIPEKSNCNIFV